MSLFEGEEHSSDNQELSPLVKSLKGALRGYRVDEQDYWNYIEEKYLYRS